MYFLLYHNIKVVLFQLLLQDELYWPKSTTSLLCSWFLWVRTGHSGNDLSLCSIVSKNLTRKMRLAAEIIWRLLNLLVWDLGYWDK